LDQIVPVIPQNLSPLNFSMHAILIYDISRYLNSATFSKNLLPVFMFQYCPAFYLQDMNIYLAIYPFTHRPISLLFTDVFISVYKKVKVIPQQAEVAQGVPGRLRPQIFLIFGTTRVVGRQPYAPAAFTPGEIPGTHCQRLS